MNQMSQLSDKVMFTKMKGTPMKKENILKLFYSPNIYDFMVGYKLKLSEKNMFMCLCTALCEMHHTVHMLHNLHTGLFCSMVVLM